MPSLPIHSSRLPGSIIITRLRLETVILADHRRMHMDAPAYMRAARDLRIDTHDSIFFLMACHSVLTAYFPPEEDHRYVGRAASQEYRKLFPDTELYKNTFRNYPTALVGAALQCVTPYDDAEVVASLCDTLSKTKNSIRMGITTTPERAKIAVDMWLLGVDWKVFAPLNDMHTAIDGKTIMNQLHNTQFQTRFLAPAYLLSGGLVKFDRLGQFVDVITNEVSSRKTGSSEDIACFMQEYAVGGSYWRLNRLNTSLGRKFRLVKKELFNV